ncbi:hypothetical protein K438DRAFT_2017966 [Mycena galopus ATCC 62051]|nr:hypothetical protein K438DRAFT_2017966 [Mycena galopus ATCC 62051]
MDSFTNTITKKAEDVVLPPTNEDGSGGSSGSCVVCKEDTTLPPMNEDDRHNHHSASFYSDYFINFDFFDIRALAIHVYTLKYQIRVCSLI